MKLFHRFFVVLVLTVTFGACFLSCSSTWVLKAADEDGGISAGVYEFSGDLVKTVRGVPAKRVKFSTNFSNTDLKDIRSAGATSVFITHDLATNRFAIRPVFGGNKKYRFTDMRSLIITFHKKVIEVDNLSKLSNKEIWNMAFSPSKMSEKTRKLSVSDEILIIRVPNRFPGYMVIEPGNQSFTIEQ